MLLGGIKLCAIHYMACQTPRANNQIPCADWPKIVPVISHTRPGSYWIDLLSVKHDENNRLLSFTDPKLKQHNKNLKNFVCLFCPRKYWPSVFCTDNAMLVCTVKDIRPIFFQTDLALSY